MSLWILLIAHFIADFSLQSAEWAEKKTKKFRYLLGHAFVYAVVFAIAAFACIPGNVAWIPFVIIVVSHFMIDWVRIGIDKKSKKPVIYFSSFLVDQILHISIIYALVAIWNLNMNNTGCLSTVATIVPLEKILRYFLIFIIILDPASVFVKKLTIYVSGSSNTGGQKKVPPVGSVIGKLERILTVILVLCGEIGAIGFVLTAKSLARYKQLNEQDFAEKYLVGTLSSTAIAIITALLLK